MYVSMMRLAIVTTYWLTMYNLKLLLRPTYLPTGCHRKRDHHT